jgi:hypothetical protein
LKERRDGFLSSFSPKKNHSFSILSVFSLLRFFPPPLLRGSSLQILYESVAALSSTSFSSRQKKREEQKDAGRGKRRRREEGGETEKKNDDDADDAFRVSFCLFPAPLNSFLLLSDRISSKKQHEILLLN